MGSNKYRIKNYLGFLLIILGIIIIINVIYKKSETSIKQKQMLELIEGESDNKEVKEGYESINGYTPIAIIEIPTINLSQPLVEGVDDDILQYFLGHFPNSAMPGEIGNFAVAGHRISDFADAFVNLYRVEIGDEVIVTTKNISYSYKITETFIVEPTDVYVLNDTSNATITLITCTKGAKQRLVVKGILM